MIFYKIITKNISSNENKENTIKYTEEINDLNYGKIYIAIEDMHEQTSTFIIAKNVDTTSGNSIDEVINKLNDISGQEFTIKTYEEISLYDFDRLLRRAESRKYIDDSDEVLNYLRIECDIRHKETVISPYTKAEAENAGLELLYEQSLLPEIERIYQYKNETGKICHPVHYIIRSDGDNYKQIVKCLISALNENNRLYSKRYSEIIIDRYSRYTSYDLSKFYNTHKGATIVARIECDRNNSTNLSSGDVLDEIFRLSKVFKRYEQDVLTIFVLPTVCKKEIEAVYKYTSALFVELRSENVEGERAKKYFCNKAKQANVVPTNKLFEKIMPDKLYSSSELAQQFSDWHSHYIRTEIYPQYADFTKKMVGDADNRFGKALKDFDEMIGLYPIKKIIYNALDYYKVQNMYNQFGKQTDSPSMHMIFTGNPGTAKTTVARLFAQILKDNDIITTGNFVEVGRADLVGKYVGHTAPLVRKAFSAADGGVLFIDEAYSLLDDKGLYGEEAINTIVQEMENHRNNIIVIFAGYPKEMDEFVERNPGLKSRIAFHVPFDDYDGNELLEIAKLMAKNKGNSLSDDAINKLQNIFENVTKSSDFGNGRYVRNIMEKAELNRASRLAKLDFNDITKDMLESFVGEDFEFETTLDKQKKRIGFAL